MSTLELYSLKKELLHAIAEASDLDKLEEVRVAALGRKGRVSELMQALGSLPPEERKAYGQVVNSLKDSVGEALEAKRREQQVRWMWSLIETRIQERLRSDPKLKAKLPALESAVKEGKLPPALAADEIAKLLGL